MATQSWLEDEVAKLRKELAVLALSCTACVLLNTIPMRH
jgi:hypothetical protein